VKPSPALSSPLLSWRRLAAGPTDQQVHLKEGQHIITVMFDFNPDKHDPEPWNKMTRLAQIDFMGTPTAWQFRSTA
jgi:hypothetical protein